MKMKNTGVLWVLVLILNTTSIFAGCAAMERKKAAKTEDLLVAAGFTTKEPPTPRDQATLQSLKPLKMIKTMKDSQTIYVYPDPYKCKCVYVGNEKQYAEYRRLAVEQNIAQENLAAAEMWQTPWPPYGWGWWW